ncbi:MAG: SMI1/KNR4 family protein [Shimia sp.]
MHTNIALTDGAAPASDDLLRGFEAGVGLRIPPQPRKFLMRTNGGTPETYTMLEGFDADVQLFFQVAAASSAEIEDMRGEASATHLAFARDSGGGQFAIAHTGPTFGQVVWMDAPRSGAVRDVAKSFDAFLARLVTEDR